MTQTTEAERSAEHMSIGEAAEHTGLTHRTLRYWEELGLLRTPSRVSGGQRLYSAEDLERISKIQRMKHLLVFSLNEIRAAVETEEARLDLLEDADNETSCRRRLEQTREIAAITSRQIQMVDDKIAQLYSMRSRLASDLGDLELKARSFEGSLGRYEDHTSAESATAAAVHGEGTLTR
ncbi:MAG: MerR family transcriptional regulator [Chloroflexia bacterium]